MRMSVFLVLGLAFVPAAAPAVETASYSYDAKGRLTSVSRVGGRNGGTVTSYNLDRADNRVNVAVTGSVAMSATRSKSVVSGDDMKAIAAPDP